MAGKLVAMWCMHASVIVLLKCHSGLPAKVGLAFEPADELSAGASSFVLSLLYFFNTAASQQPQYVNELSASVRQSLRVCPHSSMQFFVSFPFAQNSFVLCTSSSMKVQVASSCM